MNQKRYAKLIQYKAALDTAWKRRNPVSLYDDEYERTLQQAKLDKFKVLRNSKGEHKLVDDLKDGEMDFTDMFTNVFGGLYK